MSTPDPNYLYWREHGGVWAREYEDRKLRTPLYHIQELMLTEYMAAHATEAKPTRVLEFGCGVGRHLRNLSKLKGVDVYGFDQSASMIDGMRLWADEAWIASHVTLGEPVGRLPFEDDAFDIVFSTEVLVHIRPEHLHGILREIHRIARGHILHLEPAPGFIIHSDVHAGCWGHDLPSAYEHIGLRCEALQGGYSAHAPYVITKAEPPKYFWESWRLELYRNCERTLASGIESAESRSQRCEIESTTRLQEVSEARATIETSNLRIQELECALRQLQHDIAVARAETEHIRSASLAELELSHQHHRAEIERIRESTKQEIDRAREFAENALAAERERSQRELQSASQAAKAELDSARAFAAADVARTKLETQAEQRAIFEPRLSFASDRIAELSSACESLRREIALAALTRESLSEKLVDQQSRIEQLSDTLRKLQIQYEHFTASVKRLVEAGEKPIP